MTAINFNYDSQGITPDRTAEYIPDNISNADGTVPVLTVKFAGAHLRTFHSELRVIRKKIPGPVKTGKRMATESETEAQNKDLVNVLHRHIVTDWRDVKDANNKQVPFSQDACRQFLMNLAGPNTSWILPDLLEFIQIKENFLSFGEEDVAIDSETEETEIKN